MFCGSGGSKVGSLQRLMWSQLGKRPRKIARCCGVNPIWKSKCSKHLILGALLEVEMSKKCTRLWRVAHYQVKIIKTPQCGITFGSRAFEKVHAVVAHSTFSSQKCWNRRSRTTFGGSDVEKVHGVVARSTCPSQNAKSTTCSGTTFRRSSIAFRGRAKRVSFAAVSKTMAGVGHLKRICKDAFRAAAPYKRHFHQTCSEVRALISWESCILEHQNVRFATMILRAQHFVWPGLAFPWLARYFREMAWKNRKTHWYKAFSSALNFPIF